MFWCSLLEDHNDGNDFFSNFQENWFNARPTPELLFTLCNFSAYPGLPYYNVIELYLDPISCIPFQTGLFNWRLSRRSFTSRFMKNRILNMQISSTFLAPINWKRRWSNRNSCAWRKFMSGLLRFRANTTATMSGHENLSTYRLSQLRYHETAAPSIMLFYLPLLQKLWGKTGLTRRKMGPKFEIARFIW